VRSIAVGSARELRIRWDRDSEFWRDLLIAALIGDQLAMSELRLQAELLFCGELLHRP
jgi:hypothetical protein